MSTASMAEAVWPDLSNVVTEDDEPVDGVFSEKQERLLTNPLLEGWAGPKSPSGAPRPFLATANVGLFHRMPPEPPLVPDVMLSFDVEQFSDPFPKEGRSYFVWVYGKVPDIVIEVVSNGEGGELSDRLRKYERMRVPFYVVFDPERHLGPDLVHSFECKGGAYIQRDSLSFESFGLKLVVWEGVFERLHAQWLRWATLDGALVPSAAELAQRVEAEKQRAESEKQRAESEKQRAEGEKQRADALAARLRALGVDPDAL